MGTVALGSVLVAVLIGGAAALHRRHEGVGAPALHRRHDAGTAESQTTIPTVPENGPGTFVTARADRAKVGHGPNMLRYLVQVETGLDISPKQAADDISKTLADPRGWTANGVSSFQLVSSPPYDLRVRIATANTADRLCLQGIGQDTGGELNCEVPGGVVVNLKRWMLGSPTFDGPIQDYRALIINHEMGHFLGHQHETCPAPGEPAPVMMQQIKGLKGCRSNAWPYDENGHYVAGPPVP